MRGLFKTKTTHLFQLFLPCWNTYKFENHKKYVKNDRSARVERNTRTATQSRASIGPNGADLPFSRLFFNYLKLSPSYAAGCHRIATEDAKVKINSHGKQVLKCAETYGDVSQCRYSDWMAGNGCHCLAKRSAVEICTGSDLASISKADLLLCFPNGVNSMTDKELLTFIKANVPKGEGSNTRLTPVAVKNLWKNIYLSYLTFSNPDVELWRIGAEAMLVDRFVGAIDPMGRRMNASEDHARRHLTLTVLRHHQWAFNTAEHAAVNDFPCKSKLGETQGCFDFTDVCRAQQLFALGAEEMGNARAEVIRCSGARAKLSVKPTLHHQGLLF
jgi:hypothetical protein